jgi:hypothetical protein
LLANAAGQSQGRVQSYKDALAHDLDAQKFAEQQREFNIQNGLDPETGQARPIQLPKQLSQIIPNNHGKGTVTPDMLANHYAQVAAFLAGHPDQDPGGYSAKTFAGLSALIPRSTEQFATANYTNGAKTDQANAAAALDRARVQVLTTIQPAEFKAKLGVDRDRYLAQIASRREIANLDNSSRQYIAALTAQYRLQGQHEQDAFRAAVDQYNQEMTNWRSQNGWQQTLYGTGQNVPQPGGPDFSGMAQIIGAMGNNETSLVKALASSLGGNGSKPGSNPPKVTPPPVSDPYNSLSAADKQDVDATVAANRGNPNAPTQISAAVAAGKISKAVGDAILIRLQHSAPYSTPKQTPGGPGGLSASRMFPSVGNLVMNAGGSNAAGPFSP